jgi:hypothetical protein
VLLIPSEDFERREINGDSQWAYLSVDSFRVKASRHCKLRKIIISKSLKVRKNDNCASYSSVLRRDGI